jgi:hypothetical protein
MIVPRESRPRDCYTGLAPARDWESNAMKSSRYTSDPPRSLPSRALLVMVVLGLVAGCTSAPAPEGRGHTDSAVKNRRPPSTVRCGDGWDHASMMDFFGCARPDEARRINDIGEDQWRERNGYPSREQEAEDLRASGHAGDCLGDGMPCEGAPSEQRREQSGFDETGGWGDPDSAQGGGDGEEGGGEGDW